VTSADLLLHPVRLRIVQAFVGGRALTTSQLGAELSDVPTVSLYRHVARLVDAEVLQVVSEVRVRGAMERTYTLRLAAASMSADEISSMSPDEHRQAFTAFVAGLLGDFDRYLRRPDFEPLRDKVGYRLTGMWLDDAEYDELLRDLVTVFQARMANGPGKGRKRRIIATVALLGEDTPPRADDAGEAQTTNPASEAGNP
jgi:Helix-turn-helix domain